MIASGVTAIMTLTGNDICLGGVGTVIFTDFETKIQKIRDLQAYTLHGLTPRSLPARTHCKLDRVLCPSVLLPAWQDFSLNGIGVAQHIHTRQFILCVPKRHYSFIRFLEIRIDMHKIPTGLAIQQITQPKTVETFACPFPESLQMIASLERAGE